ncbi:MAG: DUF1778 domain-containing protein [Chlorobaculum sp.]
MFEKQHERQDPNTSTEQEPATTLHKPRCRYFCFSKFRISGVRSKEVQTYYVNHFHAKPSFFIYSGKLPYKTECTMKTMIKQKADSKARLEARISSQVHSTIKRAAEIQGRTVTDFVVHAALEAATKTIENDQLIRLSMEGQKAFAEALLNPPEPNEALKKAFEKHAELIGNNG